MFENIIMSVLDNFLEVSSLIILIPLWKGIFQVLAKSTVIGSSITIIHINLLRLIAPTIKCQCTYIA
jgi:hypothetical protein